LPRTVGARKKSRKTRNPAAGKRYPLNMRTTKETRDRIESAARASGRSLVQEVEHRLEQSFQDDDRLTEAFGGELAFKLMRALAGFATVLSGRRNKDWLRDQGVFDEVVSQWIGAMRELRPPDPAHDVPHIWQSLPDYFIGRGGQGAAEALERLAEELRGRSIRSKLAEALENQKKGR
jgi:hypothetical protein